MKLFNLLIGILLLFFACSVSPTTVNGKFSIIQVDEMKITMLLQISTDTGTDDLGGSTIVFTFDTTAIHFPINPVNDIDYHFHNFYGDNYSVATVTRPTKNQIWVNIDLPYTNNNNGTLVAGSSEWTEVVSIQFDIIDPGVSANLSWVTMSPFWGVFDADNSTLWTTGLFEDYITSVEPLSELPTKYKLSQNYPNPFNPSTKIKFTIPSIASSGVEGSVPVILKVYDVLGNEVATLVDEEKAPGVYEVEFSANSRISNLSSGIYIYRIESPDFVDTRKMVLLK